LSGLRLSKEEFGKYFRNHSAELSILKYNKAFLVSSHEDRACPHWAKNGCSIYHDRPTDCRLYPYEIMQILEKREKIEVTFRDNPGCPQRDQLLMPVEEATALIEAFCQTVYGRRKPFFIRYAQKKEGFFQFFSFFDPIIARLSKWLRTYRG
jgi:Fe-S-cluster containining protein